MNKTFKVVYNRARAGLMVANEITSSVQKRGTKTVVAVGVAMLMVSGAVLAQDIEYSQTSENDHYGKEYKSLRAPRYRQRCQIH